MRQNRFEPIPLSQCRQAFSVSEFYKFYPVAQEEKNRESFVQHYFSLSTYPSSPLLPFSLLSLSPSSPSPPPLSFPTLSLPPLPSLSSPSLPSPSPPLPPSPLPPSPLPLSALPPSLPSPLPPSPLTGLGPRRSRCCRAPET